MYVEVFYRFVKLNRQPIVHWFYKKMTCLRCLFGTFLYHTENVFNAHCLVFI